MDDLLLLGPAGQSAATEAAYAELTRGIQMTTGLRVRLSQALGWIGVECHSEAMALWLLRAIVVENVSVRRRMQNWVVSGNEQKLSSFRSGVATRACVN